MDNVVQNLLVAGIAGSAGVRGRAGAAAAAERAVAQEAVYVASYETRVSRWMSQAEYAEFKGTGTLQTGAGGRTFVTLPGAPKPGGTGPVRVDFNVPTNSLAPAGNERWRAIMSPSKTPVTGITRVDIQ